MMKTTLNTKSIRTTLIAVAAVSALALPVIASASAKNIHLSYEKTDLSNVSGQRQMYERLKDASRKLCGSTDLQFAGSLNSSRGNQDCYEGTLTAVVKRLDNQGVSALHSKSL